MPRRSILEDANDASEINLSSMIDVIFILLIFFIVTTVFVDEPGVEILRPDVSIDQRLEKYSILIAITEDGKVVYGGKEIGVSGVGARVRQLLNEEPRPVIIQADANARHGIFSDVWSAAKTAGAQKISVSTRKDGG